MQTENFGALGAPDTAPRYGNLSKDNPNSSGYNVFPGEQPLPAHICGLLLVPEPTTSIVELFESAENGQVIAVLAAGATGLAVVSEHYKLSALTPQVEVVLLLRQDDGGMLMVGPSFADFAYCMDRLFLDDIEDPRFYDAWMSTPYVTNR